VNETTGNPDTNRIGAGISEDQIVSAVQKSGYPLQVSVSEMLRAKASSQGSRFLVQEEWSYADDDTKGLRSIDLRADLILHSYDPQPRVRPQLNLLIECKQSQLPYVFFQAQGSWRLCSTSMILFLAAISFWK